MTLTHIMGEGLNGGGAVGTGRNDDEDILFDEEEEGIDWGARPLVRGAVSKGKDIARGVADYAIGAAQAGYALVRAIGLGLIGGENRENYR